MKNKISETQFIKIIQKIEDLSTCKECGKSVNSLSYFETVFCELYLRAHKQKRRALFKALPETVNNIVKCYEGLKRK